MKKVLSVLVAVMLIISVTACGSGTTQKPSTTESANGSQTSAESTEPVTEYPVVSDGSITLKWWVPLNRSVVSYIESNDDNTAWAQYQKDTGIDIEWIHPASGQETETFNLLIASNNLPDLMGYSQYYNGGETQGMHDDVFLDLTDYLPKYAPDYWNLIQEDEEFYREVTDIEGRVASFSGYKAAGDAPFRRVILRQDVLDKLGLDAPKTVADYEELFEGMLSLGITPYALNKTGYEEQFIACFNTWVDEAEKRTEDFYIDGGKVLYGQIENGFRDYLELMNKWYNKGYISKDFTTFTANELRTAIDNSKIGTFMDAIVANYNRAESQGYTVTSAPYPRISEDQQLHYEWTDIWPKLNQFETITCITKDCKYVEEAVRMLNYGYTEAGTELINWGVEGVNWNYDASGKRVYNELMLNNENFGTEEASYIYKAHFASGYMDLDVNCHANLLKSEGALNSRLLWADDPNVDSEWVMPPFSLDESANARRTEIMSQINTYADEMVLKFITGAEKISDATWNQFVSQIKALGIDEAKEITQKAYDAYMAK